MLINCKTIIQYMKPLKPVQVTCRLHPVPRARSHEEAVSAPGGGHEQLQCWPVSWALEYEQALLASFYIKCITDPFKFCFPCSPHEFLYIYPAWLSRAPGKWQALTHCGRPCTKPRACHPAGAPEQSTKPEPWPWAPGLHPGPRMQRCWPI